MTRLLSAVCWLCAAAALADPARAQTGPVQLLGGALRIAGEASLTVGARDAESFFNYTDYERNALRTVRLRLTALWQPADPIAIVAELRSDDFDRMEASALYLRWRPRRGVPLGVQAGRIPPVFGAYGRRVYESDRLLIGYPLAYQYLTSLRADALPRDTSDLVRMRGRGWLSSFPVGSAAPAPGVPVVSAFRWDTGIQAHWNSARVSVAVAVTQGTLANPRVADDNGSKQISARVGWHHRPWVRLGGSAAAGGFVADAASSVVREQGQQRALGVDAEMSAGRWIVRGEVVWSRWHIPLAGPPVHREPLSALGTWVEGRYRLTPRFYVAARADRLGFSTIAMRGGPPAGWDADVRRIEVGGGWSLQRNLVVRAGAQVNRRDGGRVRQRTFFSSQVAWWF